jgi:hypothetical protein
MAIRRGEFRGRTRNGVFGGAGGRIDGRGSPSGEQGAEGSLPERFPEAGEECSGGGEEGRDRHVPGGEFWDGCELAAVQLREANPAFDSHWKKQVRK